LFLVELPKVKIPLQTYTVKMVFGSDTFLLV